MPGKQNRNIKNAREITRRSKERVNKNKSNSKNRDKFLKYK